MKKLIACAAVLLALALPVHAQLVANIPLMGMLGVNQGGTGASTAAGALANLGAAANNASTSVNGVACALGSSCTIPTGGATIPNIVWVDQLGAAHNGTTDDSTVINDAINSFGAAGGTVCLTPGEIYAIAHGIIIGNGTTTTNSTINGVHLEGCGGGGSGIQNPGETAEAQLKWTGAAGYGPMVYLQGPTSGDGLKNIYLNANGLAATAINNTSGSNSSFENLYIGNWTGIAIENTVQCPTAGYGAAYNTWRNVEILGASGSNASGLDLEGCPGSNQDSTNSTFINVSMGYSGTTGTYGLKLGFADANVFIASGTIPSAISGGAGITFAQVPSPLQQFPYHNIFMGWGFDANGGTGTSGTGGNSFPAYTGAFPGITYLNGYDTTGQWIFPGRGAGVTCGPGAPDSSFEVVNGIVTQC